MGPFQAALVLLLTVSIAAASGAEEFVPTPYTAEQIRDEWQEGLEIVTHDTTPDGETWSRTTVREWSTDSVVFSAQQLDEGLEPVGEEKVGSATWVELQNHARFPCHGL